MYNQKRLLLFDIDDTLVSSNQDHAEGMMEALSEGFGVPLKRVERSETAATAMAIAKETLKANHITPHNCKDFEEKIEKSKQAYFRIIEDGIQSKRFSWTALPNVNELLNFLQHRSDIKLGLLTANPRSTVLMKLKSAGINPELFMEDSELFGAFGCEHSDRSELVKIAQQRFCEYLGVDTVSPNSLLIIGDTPNDISCAHDNNVPCVAVATGKYSKYQLGNADYVLEDGFKFLCTSLLVLLNTRRGFTVPRSVPNLQLDSLLLAFKSNSIKGSLFLTLITLIHCKWEEIKSEIDSILLSKRSLRDI